MMQIREALDRARQQLADIDTGRIDAEVLLSHCLACDRSRFFAHPEEELPASVDAAYFDLVTKRAAGHPVAHLVAEREFWSLPLHVTPATLIPRPETECLVETVLTFIPDGEERSVLDLGTGSGAIAIAIATERSQANIQATDVSTEALAVARQNAKRHDVEHIRFIEADWFDFEPATVFDVIVSNPPYISPLDAHLRQGDVRFESRTALVADEEGLAALRAIIEQAGDHLVNKGTLILEHGYEQATAVQDLLRQHGFKDISTGHDYAGHARFTRGTR